MQLSPIISCKVQSRRSDNLDIARCGGRLNFHLSPSRIFSPHAFSPATFVSTFVYKHFGFDLDPRLPCPHFRPFLRLFFALPSTKTRKFSFAVVDSDTTL